MADDDGARIDALSAKVDAHDSKLDQILSMLTGGKPATHQQAEADTERRLDRPSTVAEQVRAELERAEGEKAAAAKADGEKSERETLAERMAKLEEKRPEPPQARRERVMWGPR